MTAAGINCCPTHPVANNEDASMMIPTAHSRELGRRHSCFLGAADCWKPDVLSRRSADVYSRRLSTLSQQCSITVANPIARIVIEADQELQQSANAPVTS